MIHIIIEMINFQKMTARTDDKINDEPFVVKSLALSCHSVCHATKAPSLVAYPPKLNTVKGEIIVADLPTCEANDDVDVLLPWSHAGRRRR